MGSRQQARVKHEMRTREGGEERRVENSGRLVASHQQTAGRRFSFSPKQFLKCALARSMFTPTNQTVVFAPRQSSARLWRELVRERPMKNKEQLSLSEVQGSKVE